MELQALTPSGRKNNGQRAGKVVTAWKWSDGHKETELSQRCDNSIL